MGLVRFRLYGIVLGNLFAPTIRAGGITLMRYLTASIAITLVASFLVFDLIMIPPNPYVAPSAISLGSGEVAVGGFCGDLPVTTNK